MNVLIYNKQLQILRNTNWKESLTLSQLGVKDAVIAFDQSTASKTATGVVVGDSKGAIYGYLRLTRSNSKENGREYIADLKNWLERFIDTEDTHALLHEDVFSKGYYRTDALLNSLKQSFYSAKRDKDWKFPIYEVKQQLWKSTLFDTLNVSRAPTKENVQYHISKLLPNIPIITEYEDVYDALGIYYYFLQRLRKRDEGEEQRIIPVTTSLPNTTTAYSSRIFIAKEFKVPGIYARIAKNRGIRQFKFNTSMNVAENIGRLVSNSNEFWWAEVPSNTAYINAILWELGKVPTDEEHIFVVGVRDTKKNFNITL